VKVHRYMICGVVTTSISGCDVCTAYRVVCDYSHTTRNAVHSLKYLLPQRRMSYNDVPDQFHNIVALARLSIRSLRMIQLDRNM